MEYVGVVIYKIALSTFRKIQKYGKIHLYHAKTCYTLYTNVETNWEKKNFGQIFFSTWSFLKVFNSGHEKMSIFLTLSIFFEWFPLTEYTIYIHRLKIWRIIWNMKKTELDYLSCATCKKNNKNFVLEKQVVLFFLQTSDYKYFRNLSFTSERSKIIFLTIIGFLRNFNFTSQMFVVN